MITNIWYNIHKYKIIVTNMCTKSTTNVASICSRQREAWQIVDKFIATYKRASTCIMIFASY